VQLSCDNDKIQKAKNAFNRNKAGDVVLFLMPGWVDVPTESEKVGTSSRINNYAPFMMCGWKVKKKRITQPFSVIDIAPTISNLLNISYPNSNIGSPLLDISY
jgi:bisphosphoglycerate-independent phosphoglycerate mutase (AlkP superfamily)